MKSKTPTRRLTVTLPQDQVRALEKMATDCKRELPAMVRLCLRWAAWKQSRGGNPEQEFLFANREHSRLEDDPAFKKFLQDLDKGFSKPVD